MAFQAVRATKEVTAGTYQTSPPGSDVAQIRLTGDNAFPGRKEPLPYVLRDVSGSNRPVQTGAPQFSTKGSLTTPFYFSQANVLLPWACTLSGSPPDLPSMTFDHKYQMADGSGTLVYQRMLGCKCRTFRLGATSTPQGSVAMQSYDFDFFNTATITSSDFGAIALSAYPTDQPVTFQLSAGGLELNTAARTLYSEVSLAVTNLLDPLYDESATPTRIWWGGRDIVLTVKFRLVSQADRAAWNALTALGCSLVFTDGVTTVTFDLQGAVRITDVKDDLPMGGAPYQMLTCGGYLDTTVGTDLTVTVLP
jgi:hypothetical protein